MSNPLEDLTQQKPVRLEFNNASQEEKIKRFKNLYSLFRDRSQVDDPIEKQRANYIGFFENLCKYPEIQRFIKINEEQVPIAEFGNKLIGNALRFYLAVQKKDEKEMSSFQSILERSIDAEFEKNPRSAINFSSKEGHQLNIEKLKTLFGLSLKGITDSTRAGISGRELIIEEDEQKNLAEDLEEILRHVNAYR